jgi:hypothetical protein
MRAAAAAIHHLWVQSTDLRESAWQRRSSADSGHEAGTVRRFLSISAEVLDPFAGVNLPRRINGYSEFPLLKVFNGAILARNRRSLANIG